MSKAFQPMFRQLGHQNRDENARKENRNSVRKERVFGEEEGEHSSPRDPKKEKQNEIL
jgi:hypothetical protein